MANEYSAKELWTHPGRKGILGSGGYGTVYRCFQENGTVHAVKVLKLCGSASKMEEDEKAIIKEAAALVKMNNSEYVVNIRGVLTFENYHVGIVMEYMTRGSLSDLINSIPDIPMSFRLRVIYETASGLNHLHSATFEERISHNDLKPENILLDGDFHAKICDLGGSDFAFRTSLSNLGGRSTVCTVNYAAPEFLDGTCERRTRAMDVYSFGMAIYFVLNGKDPFRNFSSDQVTNSVTNGERPDLDENYYQSKLKTENDRRIFKNLALIMRECWKQDPKDRPEMYAMRKSFKELNKPLATENKTFAEKLKHQFPLKEPKMDKDCVNLENQFFRGHLEGWKNETYPEAQENNRSSPESIVDGATVPKIKADNFNWTLQRGAGIEIETPTGIYMCRVDEIYSARHQPICESP